MTVNQATAIINMLSPTLLSIIARLNRGTYVPLEEVGEHLLITQNDVRVDEVVWMSFQAITDALLQDDGSESQHAQRLLGLEPSERLTQLRDFAKKVYKDCDDYHAKDGVMNKMVEAAQSGQGIVTGISMGDVLRLMGHTRDHQDLTALLGQVVLDPYTKACTVWNARAGTTAGPDSLA